jgi:hypothetical protein
MQICCTKNLQTELGITPELSLEENDLFCWSAHLITINRRKAIVVVNDSNRFGFVLYGLKAKDLKNLKEIILKGIKKCLTDEKIKEEVIEKYIKSAGDVVFTKTRGAKYVSRLNKACETVKTFSDMVNPNEIYQDYITGRMNHDFVKINKPWDYEYTHDLLMKDLEQFAGGDLIKCEAVNLIVKLNLGKYKAWRRIITPVDITFKQLHVILQVAFNWKDYHLHNFSIFDKSGKCLVTLISKQEEIYEPYSEGEILLDEETRLSEYADKDFRIVYCYDYGDNWNHEITIETINTGYDKNYPVCLMGEGNAPPEDVGGISGYIEFLNIISNPNHKEYRDTCQWAQSQGYKEFDIDMINRRLKNILRFSIVF